MTTPKVQTIKRQDSRFYVNPDDATQKVPGVTSILNMYAKPFLQFWSAKVVAEFAVDNLPSVTGLAINGEREAAVDLLKNAPRRTTGKAADTGTAAHEAFERMAKGQGPGRITPDIQPFVDHFQRFLDDQQPEITFQEETIWSDEHRYAGSFDAFGSLDGRRFFIDWKTTRSGIHEEVGLQLAAYRFSDHIIRQDGSRVPTPAADGGLVVHVRPEGLKVVEVKADEEMFERFLDLRRLFDYDKNTKSNVIGDELYTTYGADESTGPKRRVPRARRAVVSG